MKYLIKYIIRYLGLGNLFRSLRSAFYWLLDFLGTKIFFILKIYYLLPKTEKFNKQFAKKILIIRIDRIGDIILSTPAIRAVRTSFPEAEINLLISEYTRDLVANNPHINNLIIYGKDKLTKDYDLAIALHPGIRQNHLTFISGAKFRTGYTGCGGGFFLTHKLKDDRVKRIRHEVDSALEVVEVAGCKTEDKRLEISITEEGKRFAEDFLKQNNLTPDNLIIAIHPGARQAYIRWRKEGFAEVSDRLAKDENAKIILIGSKEEIQLIEETARLMRERPLFAVGFRLTQLVSLIKRCSLFIGNSTGPMHIASALSVPVVAIFGSRHPLDSWEEWGPWSEHSVIVSAKVECVNCHPTDCKTFVCMKNVTIDNVYQAALKLLGR